MKGFGGNHEVACTTEDDRGLCAHEHCENCKPSHEYCETCNLPREEEEGSKGDDENSSGCTWSDDASVKLESESLVDCESHEPGCELYNQCQQQSYRTEKKRSKTIPRARCGNVSYYGQNGEYPGTSLLSKRKSKHSKGFVICSQNSPSNKLWKTDKYEPTTDNGSGDNNESAHQWMKPIHMYPALLHEIKSKRLFENEKESFPFKNTPSGNYILEPKQVMYESKALGIVAADPDKVSLNVTQTADKIPAAATKNKSVNENWTTTCLYTTVNTRNPAAFGSETSDTFSDFDTKTIQPLEKHSELSLSKMGYTTDNCIDWKNLKLPMKSDLQKLIMDNILNRLNTDTQVKIGESVCKCHKLVLQSYCAYFNSKPPGQVIVLPETEVTKDIFEVTYQWMLERERESYKLLTRDNILHVFNAAKYLGIKELEEQCWAFMDNTEIFCEDKAFLLYLEARGHNNKQIMELMIPRVQRFFLTLVSSKEFVQFSLEEVCTFLRSNYICIHNEFEVFMAGVRWLDHDWEKRGPDTVKVMQCVRFGLISPKVLINIRRSPLSPEFHRIADIPEVAKMIADGVALGVSKCECKTKEEFVKSLKDLNLVEPEPRNWSGTDKTYHSYQEFLKDLSHYRSKQRIEKRHSKMKMKIQEVNDDDFLADAVLPPTSTQRIHKLPNGNNMTSKRVIPDMDPREVTLLKNIINEKSMTEEERRDIKKQLCKRADEAFGESSRNEREIRNSVIEEEEDQLNLDEIDEAARKIQKAYRTYSQKKIIRASMERRKIGMEKYQKKATRSLSDPSHLSGLMRSSTCPAGTNEENALPLELGKDTVFVFGGSDPFSFNYTTTGRSSQGIFQYQSTSNSWRHCKDMPVNRFYHCTLYFRGKIYIAGGKDPLKVKSESNVISRKVWCYDPRLKQWLALCDMLHARRCFNLVGSHSKIFAIGGRDDREKVMTSVEVYSVETDEWQEVAPLNIPRSGAGACELRGRIWVAGGLVNIEDVATNTVEYYNYQEDKWILSENLRFTHAFSVLLTVCDRMYLIGGTIGLPDQPLTGSGKQVDVWDPHNHKWALISRMTRPRHAHAATFIKDKNGVGHVVIMGGMNSKRGTSLDCVECWDLEDDSWILGMAPIPYAVTGLAALTLPVNIFR